MQDIAIGNITVVVYISRTGTPVAWHWTAMFNGWARVMCSFSGLYQNLADKDKNYDHSLYCHDRWRTEINLSPPPVWEGQHSDCYSRIPSVLCQFDACIHGRCSSLRHLLPIVSSELLCLWWYRLPEYLDAWPGLQQRWLSVALHPGWAYWYFLG